MSVPTGQVEVFTTTDHGHRLRRRMEPFLVRHDERGLVDLLNREWEPTELAKLLRHDNAEVAQRAALALGLIGEMEHSPSLARALHHSDYFVTSMAERALWSIWFRASSKTCCKALRSAVRLMNAGQFGEADRLLDRILITDSEFAEASNRRAVLYYLTEQFELSIMACNRALVLNPHHFGAAAGLGHNYVQLGRHSDAVEAYRRALHIHPRMEGVRQALRQAKDASANEVAPRRDIIDSVLSLAAATRPPHTR